MLDLVTEQQAADPANAKLVVKIGSLPRIKAMLEEAHLSNSTESLDTIFGKVVDTLNRSCLAEAKEYARAI